jgi:neutral ceramidase
MMVDNATRLLGTLYGPHTLSAYIQEFRRISLDLLENRLSETSAPPRDSSKRQVSFIPPVELDTIGLWRDFGSVAVDAKDTYTVNQSVVVSFRSASPRNDHRIEGTFLTVDILDEYGHWQTLYVDGDWCTKLIWKGGYLAETFADIHWDILDTTNQGLYRICHFGARKTLLGLVVAGLLRSSSWFALTALGSPIFSWVLSAVNVFATVSYQLRRLVDGSLHRIRLEEFQGCSKTFLVHK